MKTNLYWDYLKILTLNTITLWIIERRKLIENIKVEVPNTVLISKDILFHVSKFLEKMVFQLIFKIIKWCFSFKTEDLVFAWFWPDYLDISWKYRG